MVFPQAARKAARLQSAALDRKLTWLERFGLKAHLLICQWCRRYGRQITFLRSAANESADERHCSQPLPPDARERIQRSIQSHKP